MTQIAPATTVPLKPASLLDRSLNLGGAASTAQLYAAYVLGGAVADAASVGLYNAETCAVLLSEQRALVATTRDAARRLHALKSLSAPERCFLISVEEASEAVSSLLDSIEALSRNPTDVLAQAEYGRERTTTLSLVRRLLGSAT